MDLPLLENGSSIVDVAFLSSQNPSPPANSEVVNDDADIVSVISEIAAEFRKQAERSIDDRPGTDAALAALLHRRLELTLNQAAQRKFWHYIAVVKCPQYTAWRWFNAKKGIVPKTRYIGPWHRNAFGRLWWWAECTRDPDAAEKDQYVRTVRAGQSQEFMKNTIENLLCGNRAVVASLCDAAFPESGVYMKDEQHRDLVKRVNAMLVTTALDALSPSEIGAVVQSLAEGMHMAEEPMDKPTPRRKRGIFTRLVGRE